MDDFMRTTTIILAGVLTAAAAGRADDVRIGKIPYAGATILGVQEGSITFRISTGKPITKPISEVSLIKIGQREAEEFNKAEDLLAKGKSGEAAAAYDAAEGKLATPWAGKLLRYRRLMALNGAGHVGRAVEEWLALAEQDQYAEATLALGPTTFAKQGSKENAQAIAALEAKLATLDNEKVVLAFRQTLMKLYAAEGRSEDAANLAKLLAGAAVAPPPKNGDGPRETPSTPTLVNAGSVLNAVEVLLQQGAADKALEILNRDIDGFDSGALPRALLLRGRAGMDAAGKLSGKEAEKMLLQAGLDFMRVVTFYPDSVDAPESLFLAGRVNASLETPNTEAARLAWQQVVANYGGSEAAKQAQAALDGLKKGGGKRKNR